MSPQDPLDTIQRLPEGPPLEAGRWCTYKQLLAVVHSASAMNLNRQLPKGLVRRLDPQGINTFAFVMLHDHIAEVPVPEGHSHVRTRAFIKLRSRVEAYETFLDVPYPLWRRWRVKGQR